MIRANYRAHSYRNPLYNSWKDMRKRCSNPNRRDYKWYGGKGITVCAAWQDFQTFCDDMLPTYFEGGTVNRIDNEGNYEPSNCNWKTLTEQQSNRTNTPHTGKYQEVRALSAEGYTQEAIGELLNMHQGSVSRILRYKADCT